MRLHETVLRMREWLLERDVELFPAVARADELYAVEADAAFRIPMTHHRAERFAFSLDGIG